MSAPAAIPAGKHTAQDFVAAIKPAHLVYFLCNVGDGDSQLLLLPEDALGRRRILVVDAATKGKLPALVDALEAAGLVAAEAPGPDNRPDGSIALVVATHPHSDHIGGIAELLQVHAGRVAELWDPGYYHTTQDYHQLMAVVESSPHLQYAQPSAGYRRWFGNALVTVLSPAVGLRNRFDTYGTEINDASISLRVEFPAARAVKRDAGRRLLSKTNTMALVLGADAQTLSWSYVLTDFPELHASSSDAAKAIKAQTGTDLLAAKVLKVSHHASKHGVNLELVERMSPALTLVSSRAGGSYGFPHTVAQELIREALEPVASRAGTHKADHELGVFYTCDQEAGQPPRDLGSIAVVMGGGQATVWRFGDAVGAKIDFATAERWTG
ncbi:MAG: MBL fold metallo-hydrolase [Dehalococcoidia bacterium]|nr:MBL fold metallo-hydrolase [Dehalococcoidia bacterium]